MRKNYRSFSCDDVIFAAAQPSDLPVDLGADRTTLQTYTTLYGSAMRIFLSFQNGCQSPHMIADEFTLVRARRSHFYGQ